MASRATALRRTAAMIGASRADDLSPS
jgi:hypothetical protein